MVTRWKFYDPVLDVEETIFLNPQEMRLPTEEDTISEDGTLASDGRAILSEGSPKAARLGFRGVALTLEQIAFLQRIRRKKYQVRLTDDFGREWWVYPYKLELTRGKTVYPHTEKHSYDLDTYVLDWPDDG